MKISEVISQHPAVAQTEEYNTLLRAGEDAADDIIAYIMNDHNAEARRIAMLRHLDELIGDVEDEYTADTLDDFMFNSEGGEPAISPEEIEAFQKDMKLPPYHLQIVEGEENTGEYEVCQKCNSKGCDECEEGLKDVTGQYRIPDFKNSN